MSFKVYAYRDPYRLSETHFWKEVSGFPHLFSAQVMVNAYRELNEAAFGSLMCPIDDVVEAIYRPWFNNIERYIEQYVELSNAVKEWETANLADRERYKAVRHDFGSLVEALRLFFELGIEPESLDPAAATFEQNLFIDLLKRVHEEPRLKDLFVIDIQLEKQQLVEVLRDVMSKAIREEREKLQVLEKNPGVHSEHKNVVSRRIRRMERTMSEFTVQHLRKVIIHGVHQFSPLQLRFIELLDSLGTEVVFLFNYEPDYPTIYGTWESVYSHFGVDIEQDRNLGSYSGPRRSQSHHVARALGDLVEGRSEDVDPAVVENVEYLEFRHLTEYASFVSGYFNDAISKSKDHQWRDPFQLMSERVYAAAREIHDLLRVYYPGHSGDRHFLYYPVGQFFLALYEMWDPKTEGLILDWDKIRECFTAGILRTEGSHILIELLDVMQPMFSNVQTMEDFQKRLAQYKELFRKAQTWSHRMGSQLRRIAFYSPKVVREKGIEIFGAAMTELHSAAVDLFGGYEDDYVSFKDHFEKVRKFMHERRLRLAEEAEKELVDALIERLKKAEPDVLGTIQDLRQALFFFMRHQERERPDWIVRNFAQLEGDILRSRRQQRETKGTVTYHFGNVCDEDMIRKVDDLLPWPLTDAFLHTAYSNFNWKFKVYYTSLVEYSNFMRYALFYGLYFNEANFRLSYVVAGRNERDNNPYHLLSLLGCQTRTYINNKHEQRSLETKKPGRTATPTRNLAVPSSSEERMGFLLCPHSFLYDTAINGGYVVRNGLALKRYYANMLTDYAWQKAQRGFKGRAGEARLESFIREAEEQLKDYFPFWQEHVDFYDSFRESWNYITGHVIPEGKRYDAQFMDTRFHYAKAWYTSSVTHPFPAFSEKISEKERSYVYSLRRVENDSPALREDMTNFFYAPSKHSNFGDWCVNCNYNAICLEEYRRKYGGGG